MISKLLTSLILYALVLGISCHRNTQPIISNKAIVNGDFEQDLSVDWIKNTSGLSYSDNIDRAVNLDSDENYELVLEKVSAGHIKLFQTIDITTLNMQFSASANLRAYEYNPSASYWAAAAVCLRYLGENNGLLGETRIARRSPHCPWQNSGTLHIINVTNESWQTHSFNLRDELLNLSSVNLDAIKKIQVVLMDTTNGC